MSPDPVLAGPEGPVFALVNLGIRPDWSTNHRFVGPHAHNALSLGLAIDEPYLLSGLQASLGAAFVMTSVRGVQLAGGMSGVGSDVLGVQLGGLFALANHSLHGLQLSAGLASIGEERITQRVWPADSRYRRPSPASWGVQVGGVGTVALNAPLQGVQLAGGVASAGGFEGLQVAGLFAGANEAWGLQLGGVVAQARIFRGLLLSGGVSWAEKGTGLQGAGLVASSSRTHVGLQVAPFTRAETLRGVQVGLVNRVVYLEGVQVGLVNLAETPHGLHLAPVTLVRGVATGVEAWASELLAASIVWRTGTPALHSLVGAGVAALGELCPTALVGLGTRRALAPRWDFAPDLVYAHAIQPVTLGTAAQVLHLRLPVRWTPGDGGWWLLGPTLNAALFERAAPGHLPLRRQRELGSRTVHFWPGLTVGVGGPVWL